MSVSISPASMEKNELIPIGKAAQILGVSVDTLRRWDKSGKLVPTISPKGHRRYLKTEIEALAGRKSLLSEGLAWVSSQEGQEPEHSAYCRNSSDLQFRVKKLETALSEIDGLKDTYPLIVAAAGEIANNSFDHNIGNWPDIPGIFFSVDYGKRQILLADRGQGILKTLRRVKPELADDSEALETAFTEIISGRAPEERGNGLKFVKRIIPKADMSLLFQTGNASMYFDAKNPQGIAGKSDHPFRGCLALISF